MDHDRLLVGVVIEDDDLQQAAGAIGTDDEVSAGAGDHAYGKADGMQDVFVEDAVLSRTVRDVHDDKVALSPGIVKVSVVEPTDRLSNLDAAGPSAPLRGGGPAFCA